MKNKFFITLGTFFLPMTAFAQQLGSFRDVVGLALNIVYYLMQTIFALFSLGIVYTVYKYITALNKGDGKTAGEMRSRLIWAIVGMAVLFSIWGIVYLLANTLGWQDVGVPLLTAPH
jgi:hypothetical protein